MEYLAGKAFVTFVEFDFVVFSGKFFGAGESFEGCGVSEEEEEEEEEEEVLVVAMIQNGSKHALCRLHLN